MENFPLRTFSRTLGHDIQAMFSLNILRRLSQNIFRMFFEKVILKHSGKFPAENITITFSVTFSEHF